MAKSRKLSAATLSLALMVWATVVMAAPVDAPVLQCSMSAHDMMEMSDMPCCPDDGVQAPVSSMHPTCCEVRQAPDEPVGFVVSTQQSKAPALDVVAVLPVSNAAPAAEHFATWGSVAAPQYVKPILELKTDLRI